MDLLIEKIMQKQNPSVIGLDPQWSFIPDDIKKIHILGKDDKITEICNTVLDFNKRIITAVADVVPAVKPNCAFYEQFGWQGMRVLNETIEFAIANDLYVIADGKRNDIGTTMASYAKSYIGETEIDDFKFRAFHADALTVNPYLGSDGILPATELCTKYDKDIFVLAKTSNPSSGDLQDRHLMSEEISVYEQVGLMCNKWGENSIGKLGFSSVGIVIGATYPKQLSQLRESLPNTFFLVPGYGAQGADASDIKFAFNSSGVGAIVNSSRAIMCAYKKHTDLTFGEACFREALIMRSEILNALNN